MSRERASFETHEERLAIYERDHGLCAYCGRPVDINSFTVAHRIARTKAMLKKYGREVIEHPLNKATTHPGACNDLIQCTNRPVEREHLASLIRARIDESSAKYNGSKRSK
jgi:5-methylcytosine-specific restriction endonuclease McrA